MRWLLCLPLPLIACAGSAGSAGAGPSASSPRSERACAPPDPGAIVAVMRAMFAALAADDHARLRAMFAPGFYAYENGKRFDGMAVPDLIKAGHASGKRWVWTVEEPEVHIDCTMASIAYVNRGSLTDAAVTKPITWLESALLGYEGGAWRIRFFTSVRSPP